MHYWNRKIPWVCYFFNSDDDDYNQGHAQIKEAFKALTKDDILQPYIYLVMNLDHLIIIMILVRIYTFSI